MLRCIRTLLLLSEILCGNRGSCAVGWCLKKIIKSGRTQFFILYAVKKFFFLISNLQNGKTFFLYCAESCMFTVLQTCHAPAKLSIGTDLLPEIISESILDLTWPGTLIKRSRPDQWTNQICSESYGHTTQVFWHDDGLTVNWPRVLSGSSELFGKMHLLYTKMVWRIAAD